MATTNPFTTNPFATHPAAYLPIPELITVGLEPISPIEPGQGFPKYGTLAGGFFTPDEKPATEEIEGCSIDALHRWVVPATQPAPVPAPAPEPAPHTTKKTTKKIAKKDRVATKKIAKKDSVTTKKIKNKLPRASLLEIQCIEDQLQEEAVGVFRHLIWGPKGWRSREQLNHYKCQLVNVQARSERTFLRKLKAHYDAEFARGAPLGYVIALMQPG